MSVWDRFDQHADKTFNDAAARYLDEFEGKSLQRQEIAIRHVKPYIGALALIDVDDGSLRQYKKDRRAVAMCGTVNKELSTVTAVLNKAARVWRWIPQAPMIQRVTGDVRKAYPLTWDEQIKLFSRFDMPLRRIALFTINTGVRREEVFKLKWADQRDIDGVIVFILRDTKNGQDRPVVCNSIAARIIGYQQGRDSVYVFPRMAVAKPITKAWLGAGLPSDPLTKKGIHNLRHTFGHRLRSEGVPAEDRDMLLGHHNRSLSQHYAVPDITRLAELAERVTVRNDVQVLR